ncbi:GMC family oxidoreductase [Flavivirga amylovorans]|uniref:GMC family oxidoreductase n=1 Tax=Flavivirga amylovorans TaxID=870486 RepID=A0ABT8X0G4_9FLAO|nr:GMC family oxidoreductase [Flavivirga amylovorans]MDO5987372.1 GMC family oxidoreductase [Flavivirga amylovorans]
MIENAITEYPTSYDAIVIGTGISGGWAAKELCENGLKTLVLDRGRMVKHIEDYPTMHMDPWDFKHRGQIAEKDLENQKVQSRLWRGALTKPATKHWFVDDLKHPYNEVKEYLWLRGYHVGGRSLMWGRHSYRLSDMDFEANKKDGHGVDWPIRYKDIAPWYDKVEEFIGVSGQNLGLSQLPDGKLSDPMELNCVEKDLQEKIENKFDDGRVLTPGRVAHKTGNATHEGRSNCQYRNRCIRGCPFGGYFSSNSSTLPAAERTGNMHLRPNSIAYEIVYDEVSGLASGVKVIDAETKEKFFFKADIIFNCASALGSTSILLQSKSKRFPNGLGNDSGELGHNLMDHHYAVGASAEIEGFDDKYYKGRKPNGFYIPRFRNLDNKTEQKEFIRGYGYQGGASRTGWQRAVSELSFGKELKEDLLKPGPWRIGMSGFGECLPYHENKVSLNYDVLDEWGLPTLDMDAEIKENEIKMREDMRDQAVAMLEAAGYKNVKGHLGKAVPGACIHEMGTARMGHDPKTSILNKHNQVHTVPNVYVTDGACMTSSACQNPSLTYMALTARAANHAAAEFKKNKTS